MDQTVSVLDNSARTLNLFLRKAGGERCKVSHVTVRVAASICRVSCMCLLDQTVSVLDNSARTLNLFLRKAGGERCKVSRVTVRVAASI